MHVGQATKPVAQQDDGGECARKCEGISTKVVANACTSVCQNVSGGKSCSKICKFRVQNDENMESAIVYAIIDDQSNATLAKPELFDALGIVSGADRYTMQTCAGEKEIMGRNSNLLSVKS